MQMRCAESLIDDLKIFFESASVPVRRAVMATLLSQLPVFFNNTDEIQNYINDFTYAMY